MYGDPPGLAPTDDPAGSATVAEDPDGSAGTTGEYISINGVGVEEWSLQSSSGGSSSSGSNTTRLERHQAEETTMIQNICGDFDRVCIDSGAGESVCPVDAFPQYGTFSTGKNGVKHRAAGGQELVNVGEERPHFTTNGIKTSMTFQCAIGVKKPLAAASNITAKGNRIVLDDANSESYIENKACGVEIPPLSWEMGSTCSSLP